MLHSGGILQEFPPGAAADKALGEERCDELVRAACIP